MKKLMVMLSAAALAFGLHAAGGEFISGTAFEDGDGGTSGDLASGYWTLPAEGQGTATITEGSHGITQDSLRPEKFIQANDTSNLVIKTTFGNPVKMNIGQNGTAEQIGDGGLYFDGLVNMTVCDYEDTPVIADESAKLAVYLQAADAEETTTKLVIKAGCIGSDAKAYECPGLTEGWHRLTIKAIKNIYTTTSAQLGFVVFVDGNAVGSTDNDRGIVEANLTPAAAEFYTGKKLFPSMVPGDDITYIGFDGQGKVDELVFTSKAPDFAKDSDFFTLSWQAGVTGFTCGDITKSDLTGAGSVPVKITLPEKTTEEEPSVVVNVKGITYAEDKVGESTTNFTATAENLAGTITAGAAAANFNGKGYATVAKAIADANAFTTPGNYTLKLFEGAEAVAIGNATEGVNLTLDLAGKTIAQGTTGEAAITVSAGVLTIADSVGGGIVAGNGTESTAAIAAWEAAAILTAGQYDGPVTGDSITVSGETTKISVADNVDVSGFTVLPEGKVLVKDETETYWIVDEPPKQGWAIYLAQGATENEFLIQDEGDLLDLATNMNKSADFPTEGITFKQTVDIPLTETFPGIGFTSVASKMYNVDNGNYVDCTASAKDCVSFTIGTKKENVQAVDGTNRWEYFKANAFAGTYDGQGHKIMAVKIPGGDYTGFFNSAYKATIKDLSIGIADNGVADQTSGNTAGLFVGVARECEMIGLTALAGEFKTGKDAAGIVAYMAGGKLVNCTNNMNVTFGTVSDTRKGAGLVVITQWGNKLETEGTATIKGCVNNGTVTGKKGNGSKGPTNGCGGLIGYTGMNTTIEDSESNGSVTAEGSEPKVGTVVGCANAGTATSAGVNTAVADKIAYVKGSGATVGFDFATVAGNVATFVAAPALNGEYKVMSKSAAYEFTEVGSITFDNSLVTTFAPTADTEKFTLTHEGYVWTCAEKSVGPTSDEGEIVMPTDGSNVAKFTPKDGEVTEATVNLNGAQVQVAFPTQIETIKGVPANQIIVLNSKGNLIDASAFVGGDDKGYSTALTAAAQKPAFATTTEGETAEKPFVVGDDTVALGVQTINGLIYQLQAEAALDNSWTAAGDAVEGNGQPMTFSTDKTDAPAQFYSIKVSK